MRAWTSYLRLLGIALLLAGAALLRAEAGPDRPEQERPKRVLLVTHAGGFMHDSILTAEQVLKEIGPKHGLEVTCYRFTADPDAKSKIKRKVDGKDVEVETKALDDYSDRYRKLMGELVTREQCGRVNAQTLKKFDAVLFFTTSTWSRERGSHPLTEEEVRDLIAWVKTGGAFTATHCATDTLHGSPYGELVGATFGGHPWVQKVRLRAEDPKHPAAKGLTDGSEIFDEIYQFGVKSSDPRVPLKEQPYSRARLHVILSIDNRSIDVTKGSRPDQDYPVSWCQQIGKGRSFYTSLGHHKEVWKDPRFQEHLLGGLKWALQQLDGDATPSAKLKRPVEDK
jgi:type 1 glutamine amidotransferase